jgi:hypothetical protein
MKKQTICIVIMLLLAIPSHAAVIFSTLGPGDTYNTSVGYAIGVSPYEYEQGNSFAFSVAAPYYLDTIELAVGHVSGTNEIDVWLMSDAAGEPGAIIEAFNFTNLGAFGDNNPLLVGTSVLRPVLTPGTDYWLIASRGNQFQVRVHIGRERDRGLWTLIQWRHSVSKALLYQLPALFYWAASA